MHSCQLKCLKYVPCNSRLWLAFLYTELRTVTDIRLNVFITNFYKDKIRVSKILLAINMNMFKQQLQEKLTAKHCFVKNKL